LDRKLSKVVEETQGEKRSECLGNEIADPHVIEEVTILAKLGNKGGTKLKVGSIRTRQQAVIGGREWEWQMRNLGANAIINERPDPI
jgi:hypothetical protein